MTATKDEAGKPIAYPAQSDLDKHLADANFEAEKLKQVEAVSQGAYDENNETSKQNDPEAAVDNQKILREEHEAAVEERQKELENLRKEREKAQKA